MEKWWLMLLILAGTLDRESQRFAFIAEQGWDTSCGFGALACLMSRYWGKPADETSLAMEFFPERIASGDLTVSFADMAAILKAKGFACAGYKMDYAQLGAALNAYAPVLVHFSFPDGHFALVLAQDGDGSSFPTRLRERRLSLRKISFPAGRGKPLLPLSLSRRPIKLLWKRRCPRRAGRITLLERIAIHLPGRISGGLR